MAFCGILNKGGVMAFIDEYDFEHLKNEAENLVIKELGHQLEEYKDTICRCNDCIVDMAAISLNNVKPLYRVSLLGTLYTANAMEEKAYAKKIREAVSNAIKKVHNNPSHEPRANTN
jgi:competence protein ComFB